MHPRHPTRTVCAATLIALGGIAHAASDQPKDATPSAAGANTGLTGGSTTWGAGKLGLVEVDIDALRERISSDLQLSSDKVPASVTVPVNLAADVCGVDIDKLMQREGTPNCTAKTVNPGLKQAVLQQASTPTAAGTGTDATSAQGTGAVTAKGKRMASDAPIDNLLAAAQRLRESIQTMAQAPAGAKRTEAIRQGNRALMEVNDATLALPPELLLANSDEKAYRQSIEKLQAAAQRLRDAAQALAGERTAAGRSESIREINEALKETNEAMLIAAGPAR